MQRPTSASRSGHARGQLMDFGIWLT